VTELEKKFDAIAYILREMADVEIQDGAPVFMKWPDRWYEGGRWRCANDHVSTSTLKTDKGSRCLACQTPVHMTFPEDVDGPICIDGGP